MTYRRAATVLSLTLAACLAACGDERVPAPSAPPVSGAPIAGAPIAGTPTGPATPAPTAETPSAPSTPAPSTPAPTNTAPETTGTASAPPTPPAPSAPPAPAAPAAPAAQAPAAPAPEAALGDAAGPDPQVPGEDPIVAAQARAVSEAAAASRTGADKPATSPAAPEPKKVVEEKPLATNTGAKKADPKKGAAKEEKPELIGFDVLGAFEYTAPNPEVPGSFEKAVASIPEDIRNLGGRTITVEGYMIPLEYAPDDDGVKSFFLSRYQIGCCFGVMPRANELVEVTMEGPKWAPYVSWMPVRATGVIVVGPKEGDTATLSGIFRMHNPEVTVPEPEEVELQSDHAR